MENSRLFRSLEQKLNLLSALYDISRSSTEPKTASRFWI
jgi:hypothetical protein